MLDIPAMENQYGRVTTQGPGKNFSALNPEANAIIFKGRNR